MRWKHQSGVKVRARTRASTEARTKAKTKTKTKAREGERENNENDDDKGACIARVIIMLIDGPKRRLGTLVPAATAFVVSLALLLLFISFVFLFFSFLSISFLSFPLSLLSLICYPPTLATRSFPHPHLCPNALGHQLHARRPKLR